MTALKVPVSLRGSIKLHRALACTPAAMGVRVGTPEGWGEAVRWAGGSQGTRVRSRSPASQSGPVAGSSDSQLGRSKGLNMEESRHQAE